MSITDKFRRFIADSRHVMNISYRPTRDEFDRSAKIIIIGILLMGAMGFAISIVVSLIVSGTI